MRRNGAERFFDGEYTAPEDGDADLGRLLDGGLADARCRRQVIVVQQRLVLDEGGGRECGVAVGEQKGIGGQRLVDHPPAVLMEEAQDALR